MARDISPKTLGSVTVHCPACGEGFNVAVQVKTVSNLFGSKLTVFFHERTIDHLCKEEKKPLRYDRRAEPLERVDD